MLPAILFDGSIPEGQRHLNALILVILFAAIKTVTANIIEVKMYATQGGEFMRMHPVVMMALIMLCSSLLGVTGMFLAIPITAAAKYYMVTTSMPGVFLNPLLKLIEGNEVGPHRMFVDQQHRAAEPAPAIVGAAAASSAGLAAGDQDQRCHLVDPEFGRLEPNEAL
jgi:hypothetical protein